MRRLLEVFTLILLCTASVGSISAQGDPCSPEAVEASFLAAIDAGIDVQQWYARVYGDSSCSEQIKSLARNLAGTFVEPTQSTESAPSTPYPPPGFALDEPGIYLYARGEAVLLPLTSYSVISAFLLPAGNALPEWLPQTTDLSPLVLVWSTDISPDRMQLVMPRGGIGVELFLNRNNRVVLAPASSSMAEAAGLENGDILLAVEGIDIGDSIGLATSLLGGTIGISVDVTYLRGTQTRSTTISRQLVGFDTLEHSMEFWDSNTILLQPHLPLAPGTYCYGSVEAATIYLWCFDVVSELTTPVPTLTPTPTPLPTLTPTITPIPMIEIDQPRQSSMLSGVVDIYGSATHSAFSHYQLEFSPDPGDQWVSIPETSSNIQVQNGLLGTWDTTQLPDGTYQLRINLFRTDGVSSIVVKRPLYISNGTPASAPIYGTTSIGLNVRSGPSLSDSIIGALPAGTQLELMGRNSDNTWFLVPFGLSRGWVSAEFLAVVGSIASLPAVTSPSSIPTAALQPSTPPPQPSQAPTSQAVSVSYRSTVDEGTPYRPGTCFTFVWEVTGVQRVWFDEIPVAGQGAREVCPTQTRTYVLRVELLDGTVQEHAITATID